jgi:hypothetical protein
VSLDIENGKFVILFYWEENKAESIADVELDVLVEEELVSCIVGCVWAAIPTVFSCEGGRDLFFG